MVKLALTILPCLLAYYFLAYVLFIKSTPPDEFPILRARFGTVMWHSSNANGEFLGAFKDPNAVDHTYCYYPKGGTMYQNKGGEYIIKRQDDNDCSGWHGQVTFREGAWVSEREKLWWNIDELSKKE